VKDRRKVRKRGGKGLRVNIYGMPPRLGPKRSAIARAERRKARKENRAGGREGKPKRPKRTVEERKAERRQERQAERETFLSRLGRADPVQRSVAAMMHVLFETSRMFGRERSSRFVGGWLRAFGPLTAEHKTGLANLAAVYPEMPARERRRILARVWDNLGRATVEYAFMSDLVDAFDEARPSGGLIEHVGIEHAYAVRDSGKPAVVFGAHLGNWELTAAIGRKINFPITALYRAPSNPYIAAEMERRRNEFIDKLVVSSRGAAMQVANAMRSGKHVGIVVDQRIKEGVPISFMGRQALANPIVGVLARLFECPVIGAVATRLPDGRYRVEVTPPLELPRDAKGRVDADAVNRAVHATVERWIRENPDQWLWLHDRWRE
jgi:KDO2-lipid IV(A) lauroyltransferase